MRIDDSSICVDRNTCIACGICVERCIMDNLRLSVAPCRQVCPVNMNCQGYIRLLALGREEQALEQLQAFGPFVPIIAETCHAPCETACTRKRKDGAVHILALKKYLAETYKTDLCTIGRVKAASGKTIALAGADIFSLAAGFRSIKNGHNIVIFAEQPDMGSFDPQLLPVVNTLTDAGAIVAHSINLKAIQHPRDMTPFDAVLVSDACGKQGIRLNTTPSENPESQSPFFRRNPAPGTGTSPVFEIAAAFETAESLDRYLNNRPRDWGRGFYTQQGAVKAYRVDERVGSSEPRLDLGKDGGISNSSDARKQASRCFGCGRAFEKNQTCWYCLPCELECPQAALEVKIPYLVR